MNPPQQPQAKRSHKRRMTMPLEINEKVCTEMNRRFGWNFQQDSLNVWHVRESNCQPYCLMNDNGCSTPSLCKKCRHVISRCFFTTADWSRGDLGNAKVMSNCLMCRFQNWCHNPGNSSMPSVIKVFFV